jgi:membrane associated rhomboid family serine protease
MIPLRDHNPSKSTPLITYFIILLNVFVFLYMLTLSESQLQDFIYSYSVIPADIVKGINLHTLLTSLFLHAGLGHIFGNMIFLHVFGDNIEDKLGKIKFLFFYLACGLAAAYAQIAAGPASTIPNLGASGAIAGVMGGYILLFPHAKVDVLFIWGFFIKIFQLPAYTMLGYWMIYQVVLGVVSIPGMGEGGVAYFAHIGGFAAGLMLIGLWKKF